MWLGVRAMSAAVAALFVDVERGPYRDLADCWGDERDARGYAGELPIVAHPPCQSWGSLWGLHRRATGNDKGSDGGCFAAAVGALREWGGVLEHPAHSAAWACYRLPRPADHRWVRSLFEPKLWACEIALSAYGFPAIKRTWIACYGTDLPPASMRAGIGAPTATVESLWSSRRHLTPISLAVELVTIASGCSGGRGSAPLS
jgi:hypothetical protein